MTEQLLFLASIPPSRRKYGPRSTLDDEKRALLLVSLSEIRNVVALARPQDCIYFSIGIVYEHHAQGRVSDK